jgi:hypothetical protein
MTTLPAVHWSTYQTQVQPHQHVTASCKTIAKKTSERTVRVGPIPGSRRLLRVDPASVLPGWAPTRHAPMGCQKAHSMSAYLTRPNTDPHAPVITYNPLAADSRQLEEVGSELHFDVHSRSGFRYRFAVHWNSSPLFPSLGPIPTVRRTRRRLSCWQAMHSQTLHFGLSARRNRDPLWWTSNSPESGLNREQNDSNDHTKGGGKRRNTVIGSPGPKPGRVFALNRRAQRRELNRVSLS